MDQQGNSCMLGGQKKEMNKGGNPLVHSESGWTRVIPLICHASMGARLSPSIIRPLGWCLLCQKKGSRREAILLTWTLSIVHCHVAEGDMAPASHVNKERDGGLMLLTLILSIVHPCHSSIVGCHMADGDLAPVSCVKKERGRGGIFLTSIILRMVMTTCIISIWTTWHIH